MTESDKVMMAISPPVIQLVIASLGGIGRHSLAQLRDPPGGKEQSVILPSLGPAALPPDLEAS